MIRATGLILVLCFLYNARLHAQCNAIVQHTNNDDQCLYAIENVVWQNLVNSTTIAPGNGLTASGTNNEVFDAGATSVNTVKNNGWVSTVIDETNTERVFGLSNAPSATPGFSRAQFGIYFINNGTLRVYESGNYRNGGDGTYVQNDVFKIAVEQSVVKYYKNGTVFYTSTVTPTLPLRVDVTLKRKNSATPVATIKQVTVSNGSDGVFGATVSGAGAGTGASYQWYLNGTTAGTNSATYTNTSATAGDVIYCSVTAGTGGCAASGTVLTSNTINFTSKSASAFGTYYAINNPAETACLEAMESAVFTSLVNVTATGNDVTKSRGTSGANDASAFSANKVGNNGYAEARVGELGTLQGFGLSASNVGLAYTTLQFSFLVRGDGTLDIYESGSWRTGSIAYGVGALLKIAVESNKVKYYVNSALVYISSVTPTLPLYVDLAFNTLNGTLNDITVVNGTTGSFTASGSPLGTSPIYDWKVNSVSTGITSSNFTSTTLADNDQIVCEVTNGLVGCTALSTQTIDLQSTSFDGTFYITATAASAACSETKEEVTFTNVINAIATANDLQKFGDNVAETYNGGAVSLNKIYNNGYAEMTIAQTGTARAFGLSATNSDASMTSIQYGIELRTDNQLHVFEGSTDRAAYTSFSIGDVIKVAVENNVVKYYRNATLLYTSTTTPTLPLVVDIALSTRSPASRIDDVFVSNGGSGIFTATSSGAGTSPVYQWTRNGTNVGTGGASYTNTLLSIGDVIKCKMRPDLAGCSGAEYESNTITLATLAGSTSPSTTWNGSVSTDWFTSSNWSNGIPRGYYKTTIPVTGTGRYPQITTTSPEAAVYDLTINTGAQLTVTGTNSLVLFDNWTNNGTFNINTSTVNLRACTNNKNVVVAPAAESFYNLVVNNTNGVELNGEHHIKGQASFTAGVVTYQNASAVLIFDDNATTSGASSSSYVSGKVRKDGDDAFQFPIGKGGVYKPLSITTPSVSDEFSAEYFYASSATIGLPKISSLKRLSGCEYWSLTHPNTATTQVTIAWVSGDCLPAAEYVSNPLFLTVSYWNGTKWADAGQNNVSGTAASGTVRSNSTSTSGYFTLASTDVVNALPVELGDVTARALKSSVQVLWKTFSENHTHVFEIQRADSTLLFASIGKVDAAGDSKQTIDYDFIDMLPSAGMNYYRIRAVDLDGSIAYSRVVAARYESDGALILFPNPVRQGEEIRISKRGRLRVIDPVKGTMIMDISNQDVIPTKGLSPGIYFAIDGQNVYNRFIVY